MSTATPFRLPPAVSPRVDLLVIAGEHSGDQHAATMVRELKAKRPGFTVAALGGPALAAAGAQVLHEMTASSVVGGAGSVLCQLSVSDAPRLDSSWWARTSLSRVRVSWMPSRGVLLSCPDFVWNT